MAWSAPATAIAGSVLTAAWLNTYLRDNENALLGPFCYYVAGLAVQADLTTGCDVPTLTTLTASQPLLMGAGFSGTADQYGQFAYVFPKQWNAGTLTYRARWSSPNAGAGAVVWALQAAGSSDGDAINQAYGTAQNVTDTFQTANKEHITPVSSALTIGGTPAKEDTVYFRIGRLATNGSDTKVEKVYLTGLELFITMNTVNDA